MSTTTARDERARTRAAQHAGLGRYIRVVGEAPLLRPEVEADLGKRVRAGAEANACLERGAPPELVRTLEDVARAGDDAGQRLLRHNMRLAVNLARRFGNAGRGTDYPLEDRLQEATIGLMRAVELFDPTKGYRFSTYATWWIRQALQRGSHLTGAVRLPAHVWEALSKLWKARNKIVDAGGVVDHRTLAMVSGLPRKQVEDMLDLEPRLRMASLDAPIADGLTQADLIEEARPGPAAEALRATAAADVRARLSGLAPRERFVLERRFGLIDDREWTLEEIGNELGLTRERIRQIESKVLSQLRKDAGLAALL